MIPSSLREQILGEYPTCTALHTLVRAGGPLLTILDLMVEENSRLNLEARRAGRKLAADGLRRLALFRAVSTLLDCEGDLRSS